MSNCTRAFQNYTTCSQVSLPPVANDVVFRHPFRACDLCNDHRKLYSTPLTVQYVCMPMNRGGCVLNQSGSHIVCVRACARVCVWRRTCMCAVLGACLHVCVSVLPA